MCDIINTMFGSNQEKRKENKVLEFFSSFFIPMFDFLLATTKILECECDGQL